MKLVKFNDKLLFGGFLELKQLIEDGESIRKRAEQSVDNLRPALDYNFFTAYRQWFNKVHDSLNSQRLPSKLFGAEILDQFESVTQYSPLLSLTRGAGDTSKTYELLQLFDEQIRFLKESQEDKSEQNHSKKIEIFVDYEKGIFRLIEGQPVRYPHVICNSKIFLILVYLKKNGRTTLGVLAKHARQQEKSTKRGIKDFNKLSRAKLKLPDDPITGDGIYELNSTHYEFV